MEKSEIMKCLSFLEEKECSNERINNNWCQYCTNILLPSYLKYKKIEEKYHNINIISNLSKMNIDQLIKIYVMITNNIELRNLVTYSGFSPKHRDTGHFVKIQSLEYYKEKIEKLLSLKYGENNIGSLISESDSAQNQEIQGNEGSDEVKKIDKIQKNQKKQKYGKTKLPKKPEYKPSPEELRQLEAFDIVSLTRYVYDNVCADLLTFADQLLRPKFGGYFVRSFVLQQRLFNRLCMHGTDILAANAKFKKSKKHIFYIMNYKETDHRFLKYSEVVSRLKGEKFSISEFTPERLNGKRTDVRVNGFDLFNIALIIYDHLPLDLPPYIDWIKYGLTDVEADEVLSEVTKRTICPETSNYRDSILCKLRLMKTRKCKNTTCFNNCVRASTLGDVSKDEELRCTLTVSDRTGFVEIITSKKKKLTRETRDIKTDKDLVNMTNHRCLCSQSVVIKLNPEQFKIGKICDDWLYMLDLLTMHSPYIFI